MQVEIHFEPARAYYHTDRWMVGKYDPATAISHPATDSRYWESGYKNVIVPPAAPDINAALKAAKTWAEDWFRLRGYKVGPWKEAKNRVHRADLIKETNGS